MCGVAFAVWLCCAAVAVGVMDVVTARGGEVHYLTYTLRIRDLLADCARKVISSLNDKPNKPWFSKTGSGQEYT